MKKKLNTLRNYALNHRVVLVPAIILGVILCYTIFLLIAGDSLTLRVQYPQMSEDVRASITYGSGETVSDCDFLSIEKIIVNDGKASAEIRASGKGSEFVTFTVSQYDENGKRIRTDATMESVDVGIRNIIYSRFYREIYPVAYVIVFLLLIYYAAIYRNTMRNNRYSYAPMYYLSYVIMFILLLTLWTSASLYSLFCGQTVAGRLLYSVNQRLAQMLVVLTLPLVLVFAISVAVSNIVLMKRESVRPSNMLGIAAAGAMLIGLGALAVLSNISARRTNMLADILLAVSTGLYLFFEIVLLSTIICGVRISKYKPEYNKDYIIILGCRVRPDGSLYPLIRGRADKAIAFYREQLAATGKQAIFIPSGGKGDDEPLSEAEAVANYLEEQGIPRDIIIPETNSTTTLENMRFSKEIIASRGGGEAVYSTTSYHVLRSGIIASESDIDVEGIGSPTKWYFWPNAFLREVAGLLLSQPRRQLVIIVIISLIAVAAGYAYSLC